MKNWKAEGTAVKVHYFRNLFSWMFIQEELDIIIWNTLVNSIDKHKGML